MFVRSRPRSNSDLSDVSGSSDWTTASHTSSNSTEKYILASIPAHLRPDRTVSATVRTHADCPATLHSHPERQESFAVIALPPLETAPQPSASNAQPHQNRLEPMESDSLADSHTENIDVDADFGNQSEPDDFDPQNFDLSFFQMTAGQVDHELNRRFSRPQLDPNLLQVLNLSSNNLRHLPLSLARLSHLRSLDLSQNQLQRLDEPILSLHNLETLIVSNNQLNEQSLAKNFAQSLASHLKVLSLSGNLLHCVPDEIFELTSLRSLYLGGNRITHLSRKIARLTRLQNLYLGGNSLEEIPYEVGMLQQLQALSLCENRIRELPSSIAYLTNLKSLALHRNELTALPPDIVKLRSLYELSLRDNPLVVRFVQDMIYNPPTLLELAGRCIKLHRLPADQHLLPVHLIRYLRTAQRCVNPNCQGVYFDTRVEQIKFVDFCGIYRLPLLQYLCSPCCTGSRPAASPNPVVPSSNESAALPQSRIRRVLLG